MSEDTGFSNEGMKTLFWYDGGHISLQSGETCRVIAMWDPKVDIPAGIFRPVKGT
jgi:hypothetical protein